MDTATDRARGTRVGRALPAARILLVVAGVAFIGSPLLLPREKPWPVGADRGAGFVLLAFVAAYFGARLVASRGTPRTPERRLAPAEVFLAVALPLYVLSIGNGNLLSSGDNLATRLLGPQIVQHGTLDPSGIPIYPEPHYSASRFGSRLLSNYPLGTGLLSVPHSALALSLTRGSLNYGFVGRLEKHFAACLMAAAAVLLFLAIRRRFEDRVALASTALFGLATTVFSTASQAMFSVTGEIFLVCVVIFLLFPDASGLARPLAAGVVVGGAFLCRPTVLIAAGFLLLALAMRRRRQAVAFGAAALVSVSLAAFWLYSIYGNPMGGYGLMQTSAHWQTRTLAAGLLGNLVSPSRGLLVFCPFLLFIPLGIAAVRHDEDLGLWWLASLASTSAVLLLVSSFDHWWGGWGLGPRLMTETAPFLSLLVLPVLLRWKDLGRFRTPFAAAAVFAALTQLFCAYDERVQAWNSYIDLNLPRLWSIRDSQLRVAWTPRFLPVRDHSGPVDRPSR